METRKVQKVGGSTFTVSVPKEWAKRQGLETSETVRLYTHRDGSLIVRGSQTDGASLGAVSVPVTGSSVDAVERSIQGAYEAGFERLSLLAEDTFSDEQRRAARTTARRLVGTEVLDGDANEIVVRAMLDASAVSIRQSLDQTVSIVSTMQDTVREKLTDDVETAGQVGDRMTDVTRLVALVRRHYNRSLVSFEELDALGIDRVSLSQYDRAAMRIEEIASATVRLGKAADSASLDAADRQAIADRLTALRTAFEGATRLVVEAAKRSSASVDPSPFEARGHLTVESIHGDGLDPSLARLFDQLRQIDQAVRAIERIGLQSAVRSGQPGHRKAENGQNDD
ncbi:AbrB/MazE/SpoVT family DNA-binding domain-containing protein [Halorhabdus rudnickae]|uniref:AbrB/MazE/SpoVT family DNA-binding domain-containing protein n=1 Tax=Halorhabdus rudnickae TaxID=1775544 RepID=UPI00108334D5|nr:AbrB/MazE/SpoVT family DNA-binding domain-containing protein [Halorhabdus rudnickae]